LLFPIFLTIAESGRVPGPFNSKTGNKKTAVFPYCGNHIESEAQRVPRIVAINIKNFQMG